MQLQVGFAARLFALVAAFFLIGTGASEWSVKGYGWPNDESISTGMKSHGKLKIGLGLGFLACACAGVKPRAED